MKLLSRTEEIVLLAVWRLQANAYGVTIRDQVSEVTGYTWSFGAIYVPLDKLTRKGHITKAFSDSTAQRGGRRKCLYELTSSGKVALKDVRLLQEALWDGIPQLAFD